MLTAIPRASRAPVKASLVNCAPWSVLKIAGRPVASASCSARTQNSASRLIDSAQDSTYRLYQSRIAMRYTNPLRSLIYVISALHTWSAVT